MAHINYLLTLTDNGLYFMRKLMTGILLAAALPASASITSELNSGATASDVIASAVATCGGSASCQELAIAEAVTAGIDITTAVNLAITAGVDTKLAIASASEAGLKAGQSVESVLKAASAVKGASDTDVIAGVTAGAKESGTDVKTVETAALKQGFSAETILVATTGVISGDTAGGTTPVVKQQTETKEAPVQPLPISPAK